MRAAVGCLWLAGEKRGSRGGGTATSGPGCNLPAILERGGGSSRIIKQAALLCRDSFLLGAGGGRQGDPGCSLAL